MKRHNHFVLRAKNGPHGLNIYLGIGGQEHYITTHRPNGLLWLKLKSGVSLGELRRVRPVPTRAGQKYYHYSIQRYLIRVVEDYIGSELQQCE